MGRVLYFYFGVTVLIGASYNILIFSEKISQERGCNNQDVSEEEEV